MSRAGAPIASMLLNMATLKDSYAPYAEEYGGLYPSKRGPHERSKTRG